MADENQTNNPAPEQVQVPSTRTNVSIRTMESDTESLKQTGGAHPMPEMVSVESDVQAQPSTTESSPVVPLAPKRNLSWIFWLIGLALLFFIGYYLLPIFFR